MVIDKPTNENKYNLNVLPEGSYLGGSLFKIESSSVGKLEYETKFEF